jgi:hypothetical protein
MKSAENYLPMINNITTLKDMDVFIANARKLDRIDVVSLAYQKRAELTRLEAKKIKRRPDINYLEIGLNLGDVITHSRTGEQATIHTDRTLMYKGHECYITPLEQELSKKNGLKSAGTGPSSKWETADGTILNSLYTKTYGTKN